MRLMWNTWMENISEIKFYCWKCNWGCSREVDKVCKTFQIFEYINKNQWEFIGKNNKDRPELWIFFILSQVSQLIEPILCIGQNSDNTHHISDVTLLSSGLPFQSIRPIMSKADTCTHVIYVGCLPPQYSLFSLPASCEKLDHWISS